MRKLTPNELITMHGFMCSPVIDKFKGNIQYPAILCALLLGSLPAMADGFLYMVCTIEGTDRRTSLASGQLISEQPLTVNTLKLKINLTEKKMRSHRNPLWVDITVEGDQIVEDTKINEDIVIGQIRGIMPLNPPGPALVDNWFKSATEYQVIQGKGECLKIDPSAWDAKT